MYEHQVCARGWSELLTHRSRTSDTHARVPAGSASFYAGAAQ